MVAKQIAAQKGAAANLLIFHAHNYADVNALKEKQMLANEVYHLYCYLVNLNLVRLSLSRFIEVFALFAVDLLFTVSLF